MRLLKHMTEGGKNILDMCNKQLKFHPMFTYKQNVTSNIFKLNLYEDNKLMVTGT